MTDLQTVELGSLLVLSLLWYGSIARMVVLRRASLIRPSVTMVLCAAHLAGMAALLNAMPAGAALDPIFWVYAGNLLVVFVDLRLTARIACRQREAPDAVLRRRLATA
ncbi:MAG: hypothetical protein RQ752_13065 [Thermohalobaculum sp.]|nr:hypothetical protein [Thermohalobaculum sp.]